MVPQSGKSTKNRCYYVFRCRRTRLGGGYCVQVAGTIAKGQWSREQRERSSTWRELMATYLVLAAYIKHLRGRTIKHRTDNQNTERILVIGSRKQHLHQLAIDIYKICKQNSIILIPEWIPREANWLSDQLSKDIDHDDYMLNTNILQLLIYYGGHILLTDLHHSVQGRFQDLTQNG